MADNIRAERQHAVAKAPTQRLENRLYAARRRRENNRRAWERARPIFEAAFRRQFSPHRFYYEPGERNRCQYIRVGINYEGKLWAFVNVYNGDGGAPVLQVRPLDAPDADAKLLNLSSAKLYPALAKLVEEWGLA